MDWKDRIVATPETLLGKPRIKGTRIGVELIVGRLDDGWTFEQLLDSYPRIAREDIEAAQHFEAERKKDKAIFCNDDTELSSRGTERRKKSVCSVR